MDSHKMRKIQTAMATGTPILGIEYREANGSLHREDGPAYIHIPTGSAYWYLNGAEIRYCNSRGSVIRIDETGHGVIVVPRILRQK